MPKVTEREFPRPRLFFGGNMALSPMMQQYLQIKDQYKDAILFFRLGDFYEMFYDDAKLVSRVLDLTLTGKQCGEEERAPMCGVPYHSADQYIGKLVDQGYSVVICEQTEDPAKAAGLVKRDVIRIVTPGTVTDQNQLADGKNNYIASVYLVPPKAALCFSDISTGDLRATVVQDYKSELANELSVYSPREVLINFDPGAEPALCQFIRDRFKAVINTKYADRFSAALSKAAICEVFGMTFDQIKETDPDLIICTGTLVNYIKETQKTDISYLKSPVYYECGQYLEIDVNTRRNLELTGAMRTGEKKGTLLWVLDKTRTSMGGRLLRKWIEQPLISVQAIESRQGAVGELVKEIQLREGFADSLKGVYDLERLMTKVIYGSANAKDLRAIAQTLEVLPELKKLLALCRSERLSKIYSDLDTLEDLYRVIDGSIVDDPPFSVREGGFVKPGVNDQLDELRDIVANGKDYLSKLEEKEKAKTGIKNMKIGFNRVFGYYIEVSKSNLPDVPPTYIRKQTLTTGERYITEELKELETKILTASDRINAIEFEIFCKLRDHLSKNVRRIQSAAEFIAETDVYQSLAAVAVKNGYTCPEVDIGYVIDIKEGRHPVVEQFVEGGSFVPNDAYLDIAKNRFLIITGPNMAGKSTYMRQIALICIMAQIGSFVPASSARVGILDKAFARIGASDDLASGQSTFMLEMTEVAYILKHATKRSLIIYDEIGRGTSTYDGMSIAAAVCEYTSGKKLGARTLFATHYHEITDMADSIDGAVNYHIAARKRGDGVVFMRKILPGAADDSYGIEVASLAGVPKEVIKRAKDILGTLIKQSGAAKRQFEEEDDTPENITIDDLLSNEVRDRLRAVDINNLTPMEALNLIWELKKTVG